MESSVSTSDTLVRPWRTATIVASLIAGVELLLLIGFAVALFGQPLLDWAEGSTTSTASSTPEPVGRTPRAAPPAAAKPAPPGKPELVRADTSVLVLNGNGIAGAAASAGELVKRKGYLVAAVGNATRDDYRRSVVMYRPGFRPEAVRLAHDLKLTVVSPLDGLRTKDLMGAHVAVVLGAS